MEVSAGLGNYSWLGVLFGAMQKELEYQRPDGDRGEDWWWGMEEKDGMGMGELLVGSNGGKEEDRKKEKGRVRRDIKMCGTNQISFRSAM